MTTLTSDPRQQINQSSQPDPETALLTSPYETKSQNDAPNKQDDLVNLYVSLKSKPLAILAGPAQSGKIVLAHALAQSLVEQDGLHAQIISGHPWWAERSEDVANLTGLHDRFSSEKILSIIEEAGQPDNAHQVFIACLTRITPAEILSFFTEIAFQLRSGQIMRLGDTHLSEPIPFPSNLRIIGTIDTLSFDWWDSDLLLSKTIMQWPQSNALPIPMFNRGVLLEEREFLQSCILGRDAAYHKIFPVLKRQRQPLYPLLLVAAILKRYISSLELAVDEVMIYLANSWSRLGNGLFHPSPDRNLAIALDLAIAQILLPRAVDAIRNLEILRNRLIIILSGQFLRSAAFVTKAATHG